MKKILIVSLFISLSVFSAAAQTGKRKPVRKTGHAKKKVVSSSAAPSNTSVGGLGSGIGSGTGSGIGMGTGNGIGSGSGSGVGAGNGSGIGNQAAKSAVPANTNIIPLKILEKPNPEITPAARQDSISGTVTLRVTFLADGQIGDVAVVSGLSDGLSENAVKAARQIKFEPQRKDGKPVTVVKMMQYNFAIF